jgi:hypothetical protein
VAESDESNNYHDETSAFAVDVTNYDFEAIDVYGASPDDIWTPIATFQEGDDVEICFLWTYTGPNPSPSAAMVFQLDSGLPIGSAGAFSPGTWNTHWTWTNATAGTHRIRGWCDYNDEVVETDESNNYRDEAAAFAVGSAAAGPTQIFNPNPVNALNDTTLRDDDDADSAVPAEAYEEVVLTHLDTPESGPYHLQGDFAFMEDIESPSGGPPVSATQDFHYTRGHDGFEWVMCYHHITVNQVYIQSLGFTDVNSRDIHVDAHGLSGANNSHYAVTRGPTGDWLFGQGYIAFGDGGLGGVDHGEDADVILHEYGHAIQDNQTTGLYFGDGDAGHGNETGAMGEGFGDYWAASATYTESIANGFDPAVIAEWAWVPTGLRRVDGAKYYPDDMVDQVHADGQIWSACLWEIFHATDKETADTLILQSHFLVPTDPTFRDGALAILAADQALYGGANEQDILSIFVNRGILNINLLNNDSPELFSDIPRDFSFQVKNDSWSGVAINPSVNHDIKAADTADFSTVYESSTLDGTSRDFIVANGHNLGDAIHYAQVYNGAAADYTIEAEWEAVDLTLITPYADTMDSAEVIQMYEIYLKAGQDYAITADISSGSGDLALFVFSPSRDSGSRANFDWSADLAGAGGDETLSFTADSSGYYGIAVINENGQAAGYEVLIELQTGVDLATFAAQFGRTDCQAGCEADLDGNGVVDGFDLTLLISVLQ